MIRKNAMSTMGYAIVLVIILGVVMILSAPMMMSKYKGDKKSSDEYSKKMRIMSITKIESEIRKNIAIADITAIWQITIPLMIYQEI